MQEATCSVTSSGAVVEVGWAKTIATATASCAVLHRGGTCFFCSKGSLAVRHLENESRGRARCSPLAPGLFGYSHLPALRRRKAEYVRVPLPTSGRHDRVRSDRRAGALLSDFFPTGGWPRNCHMATGDTVAAGHAGGRTSPSELRDARSGSRDRLDRVKDAWRGGVHGPRSRSISRRSTSDRLMKTDRGARPLHRRRGGERRRDHLEAVLDKAKTVLPAPPRTHVLREAQVRPQGRPCGTRRYIGPTRQFQSAPKEQRITITTGQTTSIATSAAPERIEKRDRPVVRGHASRPL